MRKSQRKCNDSVFGELIFNVLWKGRIELPPFGIVQTQVDGGLNDLPPTDSQKNAFLNLKQALPSLESDIYEAILLFYSTHRQVLLPLSSDPKKEVPVVRSPKKINKLLVGPPDLLVGPHRRGKTPTIHLEWDVIFDSEHGLTVEIVDGAVGEVGLL